MEIKKVLCLDLEQTMIDEWSEFNILDNNIKRIKNLIDIIKPDESSIWSFAFESDNDIEVIRNNGLLDQLQERLDVQITKIFTIQEMQKTVEKFNGFQFENVVEFIQICNKTWAFIKFSMTHKNTKFWLIDDVVPNMVIKNFDLNTEIELINVVNL